MLFEIYIYRTASQILSATRAALQKSNLTQITLVGHSLGMFSFSPLRSTFKSLVLKGAALALLDSVSMPLFLPGIQFKTIGYGLPRVSIAIPAARQISDE